MKISDVSVMVLESPEAYQSTSTGEEAHGIKYLGIVKVQTDAGIVGFADLETQPHVAKAIVDAPSEGSVEGFKGLRSVLVGEDPFDVERLWHKMYMASVYYGRRGAAMQVISGIDIALWDIIGKKVKAPVCKLLGGAYRDRVRPYASTLFRSTPEGMAEASRAYLDKGFTAVKFGWGVFGEDRQRDVELVAAARKALGDRVDLLIDTGWYIHRTGKEAIQMVKSLEPFRPFLIEEPLSPEDYDGYAQAGKRGRHLDRMWRARGDRVGLPNVDRARQGRRHPARSLPVRGIHHRAENCSSGRSIQSPLHPARLDIRFIDGGFAASQRLHAPLSLSGIQCHRWPVEPRTLSQSDPPRGWHVARPSRPGTRRRG